MTTVLITGANRGIGRALVETLVSRSNHTVIAAVRDPDSSTAISLRNVAVGEGSKVITVKVESTSHTDPATAVKQIESLGVTSLDLVVANAGIAGAYARIEDINIEDIRTMIEVNTLPVISLFQATYPLLQKGREPKFVAISTEYASIVDMERYIPIRLASYGTSKAALNFLVRRIHFENDWLTAFSINPGFAQTDMGNAGAKAFGLEEAILPVADSVNGILAVVEKARKESESGNFYSYDGSELRY